MENPYEVLVLTGKLNYIPIEISLKKMKKKKERKKRKKKEKKKKNKINERLNSV
jgi:hypothetical protein